MHLHYTVNVMYSYIKDNIFTLHFFTMMHYYISNTLCLSIKFQNSTQISFDDDDNDYSRFSQHWQIRYNLYELVFLEKLQFFMSNETDLTFSMCVCMLWWYMACMGFFFCVFTFWHFVEFLFFSHVCIVWFFFLFLMIPIESHDSRHYRYIYNIATTFMLKISFSGFWLKF